MNTAHQFELMNAQTPCSVMFNEAIKPENQHFFPFYFYLTFYMKKEAGEKLKCATCLGEDEGNDAGYYGGVVLVQGKGAIPTYHCCARCAKVAAASFELWRYEDQRHGQPKPLELPENATVEMRGVWQMWFGGRENRYRIMKHNQVEWNEFKETCHVSEAGGCTFEGPEGDLLWWEDQKLRLSKTIMRDDSDAVFTLTQPAIVKIVNEMLYNMRFKQLSLF